MATKTEIKEVFLKKWTETDQKLINLRAKQEKKLEKKSLWSYIFADNALEQNIEIFSADLALITKALEILKKYDFPEINALIEVLDGFKFDYKKFDFVSASDEVIEAIRIERENKAREIVLACIFINRTNAELSGL